MGGRAHTVMPAVLAGEYVEAVAGVQDAVEAALGSNVLTDRRAPAHDARWLLAKARHRLAWRQEHVHVADVRHFYPSVTGAVVERALRPTGADRAAIRSVRSVLERLADAGLPGLPIGPSASGVLANAVLLPADRALARHRCAHIRWVDDFALRDRRRALEVLGESLAVSGLRLHPAKTGIMDVAAFRRSWVGSATSAS